MKLKSKYSLILLVLTVVLLTVLNTQIIIPTVIKIASTDPFIGDLNNAGQPKTIRNDRTAMALIHCNYHVRQLFPSDQSMFFPGQDYKAWNVGFGRYLINSDFEVKDSLGIQRHKNYICKIQYESGDDSDFNHWVLLGLDYA